MAGHSTIHVTERHYYQQLDERRREMLSKLSGHIASSVVNPKTLPQNVAKTWSKVVNPGQSEELEIDSMNPHSPSENEGSRGVARGGIEPPTHGFSVHCSTN